MKKQKQLAKAPLTFADRQAAIYQRIEDLAADCMELWHKGDMAGYEMREAREKYAQKFTDRLTVHIRDWEAGKIDWNGSGSCK